MANETGTWRVCWEIDLDADSAGEAARAALNIMRDNRLANTAVVFQCIAPSGAPHVVDLLALEGAD